jgi:hypothetical protein
MLDSLPEALNKPNLSELPDAHLAVERGASRL